MKNRRRTKLILPEIQLRALAAGTFLALGVLGAQAIVLVFAINRVAALAPNESALILQELPGILAISSGLAFALVVPPLLGVILGGTHRIVGPLYRMKMVMTQHLAGEDVGQLRLRKGDQLQDFAGLLDRVLTSDRAGRSRHSADQDSLKRAA